MAKLSVINAHNSSVPIGVYVVFVAFIGEEHDVAMRPRIERVLGTAHVVGCVIDTQDFVSIHSIVDNDEFAAFLGSGLSVPALK